MEMTVRFARVRRCVLAGLSLLAVCCSEQQPAPAPAPPVIEGPWFSAWGAPQHARETPEGMSGSTVRMILVPSVGGTAVKVKLENTVGMAAVTFSGAYLGVAAVGAAVVPGSSKRLTFAGAHDLTLGPGVGAWSDPVPLDVSPRMRLAVSLEVESASDVSTHTLGLTTNYRAPGKHGADPEGAGFTPVDPMAQGTVVKAYPVYWVTDLDVAAPEMHGTVVAFGDSITDGRCSTTVGTEVQADLNQRWTDRLGVRLGELPPEQRRAVANAGIVGNRVIVAGGNGPTALQRLERDALDRSGVTHVIFFEGTNDIFADATAEAMIQAMQEIVDRVRVRKLKIIGVTVIPRGKPEAVLTTPRGYSAAHEQVRLAVNEWIRTPGHFDGVIDFDALMTGGGKAESGAEMIQEMYNCDYIHPNTAGYAAMGEFIDTALFAGP
jgi:lysophospholipase L1-like esterase